MKKILVSLILVFFLTGCLFIRAPLSPKGGQGLELALERSFKLVNITQIPLSNNLTLKESLNFDNVAAINLPSRVFTAYRAHEGEITSLVITSDGFTAYSAGEDGKLIEHNIIKEAIQSKQGFSKVNKIKTALLLHSERPILALALSDDQRFLAISRFSSVSIYDLKQKFIVGELTRVEGRISTLAWDPRGELIALGRTDGDVYVWRVVHGKDFAKDSSDVVEHYPGERSPIIDLVFHPSSRVFFAAHKEGTIYLWRVLRTEEEMGLRDRFVDKKNIGTWKEVFPQIKKIIYSIYLNPDGSRLFVASEDGKVYRFKVRGLKLIEPIVVGDGAVFAVAGTKSFQIGQNKHRLIVAGGRNQQLSFWCAEPKLNTNFPTSNQLTLNEVLIGKSVFFSNPVSLIRSSPVSSLLWVTLKTGNFLLFDTKALAINTSFRNLVEKCQNL